jgi:hypothetical protein
MYTGYILRMLHHLKKRQFRAHRHLVLASAQMLAPEYRLVSVSFGLMSIAARLTMNW